jgi:two-component system phosphate regulon sensor histidine kinase PhoR
MSKQIRTVLLILLFIIVPFLIYAFFQAKSLSDDEKMSEVVYERQMETVLFSLNQYADDMMSQWVRRLTNDRFPIDENASKLTLGNESIQMLVLRTMETNNNSIYTNDYVISNDSVSQKIDYWYNKEDSLIQQLTNYLTAGFQKMQAVSNWQKINGLKPSQAGITAMVYDRDSVLYNILFVIESNYWVEQVLGAKMQEIDQADFSMAVLHIPNEQDIPTITYNSGLFDLDKDHIKKKLWILPNTYLSIQPKGESHADLIRARSKNNLYFLLFSMLIVLIGSYFMIRNINDALKVAQLKSDFVSNVSHEIRTPLALIRMYAETLMLGRLSSDEKKQHYYQVIHHESGRLTYLVNNILEFSRIEANRKTYHFEEKDMNELVNKIHSNYSFSFIESDVKCSLFIFSGKININVDAQAFEEALSNLIENAMKYNTESKDISISTTIDDQYAYCHVKDEGVGIPKNLQALVFDKFYRVEDALTQKTKGTGLGLSLVKHIMDSHHGQVLLNSTPNQGSTFTLKLPLTKQSI